MASKAKKLSVIKIRKICVSGRALREEVVLKRVSGELVGNLKVYLCSCRSDFKSAKCCSSLSAVIKSQVRDFLIYFSSEKTKFPRDNYVYFLDFLVLWVVSASGPVPSFGIAGIPLPELPVSWVPSCRTLSSP